MAVDQRLCDGYVRVFASNLDGSSDPSETFTLSGFYSGQELNGEADPIRPLLDQGLANAARCPLPEKVHILYEKLELDSTFGLSSEDLFCRILEWDRWIFDFVMI